MVHLERSLVVVSLCLHIDGERCNDSGPLAHSSLTLPKLAITMEATNDISRDAAARMSILYDCAREQIRVALRTVLERLRIQLLLWLRVDEVFIPRLPAP